MVTVETIEDNFSELNTHVSDNIVHIKANVEVF